MLNLLQLCTTHWELGYLLIKIAIAWYSLQKIQLSNKTSVRVNFKSLQRMGLEPTTPPFHSKCSKMLNYEFFNTNRANVHFFCWFENRGSTARRTSNFWAVYHFPQYIFRIIRHQTVPQFLPFSLITQNLTVSRKENLKTKRKTYTAEYRFLCRYIRQR
jgi:hypothetical protein